MPSTNHLIQNFVSIKLPTEVDYWNLTIRLFGVIEGHSLGKSYPFAEMQSVYSTAPADWGRDLHWEKLNENTKIVIIYVSKVKLATIVEGNPKAPFSIATTPMCRGGRYSFPGLLYFTLDPYLITLSAKQGSIKYHFLSLWYDSTWDWTQVSRAIGEHSNP